MADMKREPFSFSAFGFTVGVLSVLVGFTLGALVADSAFCLVVLKFCLVVLRLWLMVVLLF